MPPVVAVAPSRTPLWSSGRAAANISQARRRSIGGDVRKLRCLALPAHPEQRLAEILELAPAGGALQREHVVAGVEAARWQC